MQGKQLLFRIPFRSQYINYSSVLIKTDSLGNLVFRKDLPIGATVYQDNSSTINSVDVIMTFVMQTADGGFMFGHDYASSEFWKLRELLHGENRLGRQCSLGSAWSQNLSLNSLAQLIATDDGGYTLLGSTYASVSGSSSGSSTIIHLSSNGSVAWINPLSGFAPKTGIQTSDGGYIVAGQSDPYHYLSPTVPILKLDDSGSIIWYKLYDNQLFYCPRSLIACEKGGYLFAATTPDYRCLVKVDQNGAIQAVFTIINTLWTRFSDSSISVIQSSDGNYVLAGKYIRLNTTEYDAIWLSKVAPASSGSPTPSTSPSVPEFSTWVMPSIFLLSAFAAVVAVSRRKRSTGRST